MDAKAEALVVKKCQWRAGDVVVLVLLGLLLGQFVLMSGSKPVWTDEIYTHYISAVGGFREIYLTRKCLSSRLIDKKRVEMGRGRE